MNLAKRKLAVAFTLAALPAGSVAIAPAAHKEPLDEQALNTIKLQFSQLMGLANRPDLNALHDKFWPSPSTLLVAKSAIPSEGNCAGFWGNDAIDQKLHDIAGSGPVVLAPDFSKLKIVGLTQRSSMVQRPPSEVPTYAN